MGQTHSERHAEEKKSVAGILVKKSLTYSYMSIYWEHGKGGDNLGRVQCCGGTAAAGHPELSSDAGEVRHRDCGRNGDGAAVGFEAPESFERCWPGGGPQGGSADALQGECYGHPAVARMDEHVRAVVETPAAANQGTGRGQQCTETIVLWNFKPGGNREFTRTIAGSDNDPYSRGNSSPRFDRGDVCRAAGSAGTVQRDSSGQAHADEVGSMAWRQMVSRPGRQQ